MQCFQKDPNLRVSARKLLKHPWIVNAKRSDAVVPKKPTEYDEAVKSVQQWNEALKSSNAGSLRRASRPMSSSPNPGRRELNSGIATPARGPPYLAKPRVNTEQFMSPGNAMDDNWDDDFASSISPSALKLPHLRPHDNFGGLLSSEKLKAFASFETVTEEVNWDDEFEGDLTVKSPLQVTEPDPLETIRPFHSSRTNAKVSKNSATSKPPESRRSPVTNRRAPTIHQNNSPAKSDGILAPTKTYSQTSTDSSLNLFGQNQTSDARSDKNQVGTTWPLHPPSPQPEVGQMVSRCLTNGSSRLIQYH